MLSPTAVQYLTGVWHTNDPSALEGKDVLELLGMYEKSKGATEREILAAYFGHRPIPTLAEYTREVTGEIMSDPTKKADEVLSITVPVQVPLKRIASELCTAVEQGISYWAMKESKPNYVPGVVERKDFKKGGKYHGIDEYMSGDYYVPVLGGSYTIVEDDEDNPKGIEHTLDKEKIIKGIGVMASKYPHHFKDFMDENSDATTADVFVQLCIFGEIKYG